MPLKVGGCPEWSLLQGTRSDGHYGGPCCDPGPGCPGTPWGDNAPGCRGKAPGGTGGRTEAVVDGVVDGSQSPEWATHETILGIGFWFEL